MKLEFNMKSIFKLVKLSVLLIFLSNILYAENFKISGSIQDFDSKSALIGATIKLEGTGLGAFSKNDGKFEINNIKKGSYKIIISMIGYEALSKELNITGNQNDLNFSLKYKPFETSEIVISANKRVQSVQEVPISVSIMDQNTIKFRNINRIDDALRLIPGVNLNKDNVNIRGSSGFAFGIGSRVLLLMDGFPIMSADNGDIKFDAIPMLNVERIEVIKGAGSALYGTSALGGIINILTKEASENAEISVKSYYGLYTKPRYKQWEFTDNSLFNRGFDISVGKKFDKLGLVFSGGYRKDDSYRKYDDSKRFNILSKLSYEFTPTFNIKLLTHYAEEDRAYWIYWNGLDSALIPPTNTEENYRITSKKLNINSEINYIFDSKNFINFKASIFNTNFYNYYTSADTNVGMSNANAINLELQYNSILSDYLFLTAGTTFNKNNVLSVIYGINSQTILGAYAQFEVKPISELIFTIGGRLDNENVTTALSTSSNAQREVSPKFGVSYKPYSNLSLRGSYGHGFRAPKAAERFALFKAGGFDVIPNLNLNSERSNSIEIGGLFEFTIGSLPLSLDFSLFNNNFDNLIEPTFVTDNSKAVIKFLNVTKARINGIELNLKTLLFGALGLETSITYTDPRDLTLNETLKYRSNLLWYNHIFFKYSDFTVNIDYRFISRSETIDERLGLQVIDHDARVAAHVTDLSVTYDLNKLTGLSISPSIYVKNLFDYYYAEMPGNIALTRFIGFELKYNY
jgi:outer membrane receptor for ferrienterochelin and colicins